MNDQEFPNQQWTNSAKETEHLHQPKWDKIPTYSDYRDLNEDLSNLEKYQQWTDKTAIYPKDEPLYYTVLGLVNEAGEVAGVVKKIMRDDNKIVTPEKREKIIAELGDVFWYAARIAQELDFSLEEVIEKNRIKLEDRLARDVIKGSGDNR